MPRATPHDFALRPSTESGAAPDGGRYRGTIPHHWCLGNGRASGGFTASLALTALLALSTSQGLLRHLRPD